MTILLVEQAPAKINLTLRIVGRRADGYHELESLVAFADVGDSLRFEAGGALALEIGGTYGRGLDVGPDNLVCKAAAALAARVQGLQLGRFLLTKELPVASGIGGGSADAAAVLRLLAHANALPLDDPRLQAAALGVGADVPVCVDSRARVMRGIGELLDVPLTLPRLAAVLVNPGVAVATKDVFKCLDLSKLPKAPPGEIPRERGAFVDFLQSTANDLTEPAIACAPVIGDVLSALKALPGCRLARMSGSGATCFALFDSAEAAAAATQDLRRAQAGWWIVPTTLG
jgi:4-diphosphocytidyl-2-C-methyl-D-erythritol kinase